MAEKLSERVQDKVRGCMIGGAVGDALGYPVEFMGYRQIIDKYGEEGIKEYTCDSLSGKALISDDTQMSLFTANGILFGITRGHMRGIMGNIEGYIYEAYQDWLTTQTGQKRDNKVSWILDIPELQHSRAPGGTCLRALQSGVCGTMEDPINHSKGCGGIMRVAPVALYFREKPIEETDMIGAGAAAITHGHPLGYISAAVLVHMISRILRGGCTNGDGLRDIVIEAKDTMASIFPGEPYLRRLNNVLDKAVHFSGNSRSDIENIRELGEGWVAEETLAIAIYCCLRYPDDFSKAVIAAVNHGGDSDSTGAVAGNIAGAICGYDKIPDKWKEKLELEKLILELSDDLYMGCRINEYTAQEAPVWVNKYTPPCIP